MQTGGKIKSANQKLLTSSDRLLSGVAEGNLMESLILKAICRVNNSLIKVNMLSSSHSNPLHTNTRRLLTCKTEVGFEITGTIKSSLLEYASGFLSISYTMKSSVSLDWIKQTENFVAIFGIKQTKTAINN